MAVSVAELLVEAESIRAHAASAGLVVFDGMASGEGLRAWSTTSWRDFLHTASRVGAKIAYVHLSLFTSDGLAARLLEDDSLADVLAAEVGAVDDSGDNDDLQSLLGPALADAIVAHAPELADEEGNPTGIFISWAHGGVLHSIHIPSPLAELEDAAERRIRAHFLDKRASIRAERHANATKVERERATQLASHPRWPQATNAEKRNYMATQLFPELRTLEIQSLVGLAQAVAWWNAGSPATGAQDSAPNRVR